MSVPPTEELSSGVVRVIGRHRYSPNFSTLEEFQRCIQRERARSDRTGHGFTMVLLSIGAGQTASSNTSLTLGRGPMRLAFWRRFLPAREQQDVRLVRRAECAILDRARPYDTVARLEPGVIAMLLPETSSQGAWKLGEILSGLVAEFGVTLEREVFAYPHQHGAAPLGHIEDRLRVPRSVSESDPNDFDGPDFGPPGYQDPSLGDPSFGGPSLGGTGSDAGAAHGDCGQASPPAEKPERGRPAEREGIKPQPVHDMASLFVQDVGPLRRAVDIVVASSALVLLSPVFLVAAIGVKLSSPGSVFYSQWRTGLGGRQFRFHKFRSMQSDADLVQGQLHGLNEQSGPIFKIRNDPRITRFGHLLRRTSVDELPQLWNILKGDMTLVGPRPPRPAEVLDYETWQLRRLERPGGLTCIWQVSGRSMIGFQEWMRMDLRYINQRTAWLDLRLLLQTFGAVFARRGAF